MKKIFKILALTLIMTALAGCSASKTEAMTTYKENMDIFFSNVKSLNDAINSIDTTQEGFEETLLIYLDQLDKTFSQMAAMDVPSDFRGVKELAEDATKNMSLAVEDFHRAYEGEFDSEAESNAYTAYRKANVELQYIIEILHGAKVEDLFNMSNSPQVDGAVSGGETEVEGTEETVEEISEEYEEEPQDDFYEGVEME